MRSMTDLSRLGDGCNKLARASEGENERIEGHSRPRYHRAGRFDARSEPLRGACIAETSQREE